MLMPWFLLLLSIAASQEVYERSEDTTLNTTTLYPVTNKITDLNRNTSRVQQETIQTDISKKSDAKDHRNNEKPNIKVSAPQKEVVTTWTIDSHYAHPKVEQTQTIHDMSENKYNLSIQTVPKNKESVSVYALSNDNAEDSNSTDPKENFLIETKKSKEDRNIQGRNKEEKKFIPSPHLGSFFDDENLNLLKFATPELTTPSVFTGKKPSIDYVGFNDFYTLNYKSPKDTYRDQLIAPYRFESGHSNWKQTLESKPTVETSIKIPAGSLYKHPYPFKEKPNSGLDNDDFGLIDSSNENGRDKENPLNKRTNPWKNLLQLVTAFLPVGLIISALTPRLITLHSTDNDANAKWVSRRAGGGWAGLPPMSERCRRRLLCELHSDENYLQSQNKSPYVRKHCYKLRCDEPQTLREVLDWLLAHRAGLPRSPLPGPHAYHGRGRHTDVTDHRHINFDYT